MQRLLAGSRVKSRATLKKFDSIPLTPSDRATRDAKRLRFTDPEQNTPSTSTIFTDSNAPSATNTSTDSAPLPDKQVLDRIHRPQVTFMIVVPETRISH
jgi:hypothetical protein